MRHHLSGDRFCCAERSLKTGFTVLGSGHGAAKIWQFSGSSYLRTPMSESCNRWRHTLPTLATEVANQSTVAHNDATPSSSIASSNSGIDEFTVTPAFLPRETPQPVAYQQDTHINFLTATRQKSGHINTSIFKTYCLTPPLSQLTPCHCMTLAIPPPYNSPYKRSDL